MLEIFCIALFASRGSFMFILHWKKCKYQNRTFLFKKVSCLTAHWVCLTHRSHRHNKEINCIWKTREQHTTLIQVEIAKLMLYAHTIPSQFEKQKTRLCPYNFKNWRKKMLLNLTSSSHQSIFHSLLLSSLYCLATTQHWFSSVFNKLNTMVAVPVSVAIHNTSYTTKHKIPYDNKV